MIEERIAWARYENLVAGIGEQLEEERVRLARARREHDALGGDVDRATAEVGGDGAASLHEPERMRRVREASWIRQRRE